MAISDYMEDLIYRVLAGEVDEVERKKFETWLRENDEHRVFFEKIERAWYMGKYAARWKNVEMSTAWKAVERIVKPKWFQLSWEELHRVITCQMWHLGRNPIMLNC